MANSRDYWKQRFEQVEQSQNRQGVQCMADIEKQYRQAQKQIEGQIAAWYQRFADNNKITLAEAHRLLNTKELAEFKWDVNQYIQYGQENAINKTWMKQLENASARFHINRLEALKIQTQQSVEVLFGNQLDSIDSAMRGIYTNGYYHTAYEIHKGVGVGWNFSTLDNKQISKVINKPWAADGKNFSERVWTNRQKLVNELNTTLTRNIVLGQDPQKAIDEISRKMNTSKNVAGRLVMTEEAAFSSAAQKDCFAELDVEQYEIVATLDSHTSDICQEMDGKHFQMSQWEVGTTAPPFHVWCRSTTCPYFDDEFDSVGERAARGEDGKTYYVPSNMTYKDWKKSFVDGGDKSDLQVASADDTIKAKEEVKQVAEELKAENFPAAFTAKSEAKNTQTLVDYVNGLEGADANVVALFNRMGDLESIERYDIPFKISHGKNHAVSTSQYTLTGHMAEAKLTIPKLQGENLAGQVNTTLHEEMHLIDLYGRQDPQKPGNWFSTSRPSLVDAVKTSTDEMSDDIAELFKAHDTEYKKVCSAVNDKYHSQITALNDSMLNRTYKGTYADYKKEYNKLVAAQVDERDYMARNIMGGGIGNLQDIYDALSGGRYRNEGKVIYGHGAAYYSGMNSRVHETIANYAALSITRPDLIDLLKADKLDLVAELDATIKALLQKVGE
mgnify:CR=1 FL=1